jgi:hypothetical protein
VRTGSPGARAVAAYKIQDVFLVAADCWVVRDFNQAGLNPEITYGHQTTVENSVLRQLRTSTKDGSQLNVVRYFITTEVRLLKPGVSVESREPTDEDFLARIRVTFAADYSCPHEAAEDNDAMSSFSRNAHFHAWPYIREEVSAFCGRLRIPRVMLPMWKPDELDASIATAK